MNSSGQLKTHLFFPSLTYISDGLLLFRKTSESDAFIANLKREDEKTNFAQIRCPLCEWKPEASNRWTCWDCDYPEYFFNGCETVWNTFETHGKCPACSYQWIWTSCLRCGEWSKHEDWYEGIKGQG